MAEDDTPAEIKDRLDDLARALKRQSTTIDRLAEDARAREAKDKVGADVPLLVDLFALHCDATACAGTASTEQERAAFGAIAAGIERLIAGRGGAVLIPAQGSEFDPATMEAAEIRAVDDVAQDRSVAAVLTPGLRLTAIGRTPRPARVAVYRS